MREIRRLGGKKHVWPQIYGDRALHVSYRRGGSRPRRLAKGQSTRPRRRGAQSRARPLIAEPPAPSTLSAGAVAILTTAQPSAKAAASRRLAEIWRAGAIDIRDA